MTLTDLLRRSRSTAPLQDAVAAFLESGAPNDRVRFRSHSPPVKIERTLIRILERYEHLPLEEIEIDGSSGCEFFRGTARIRTAEEERQIRFCWDCKWRAEQEGWTDYFGFPDQARAAREFGHDCFRSWEETAVTPLAAQASTP